MNDPRFINILETDGVTREKIRQWRNQDEIRQWMLNQNVISKEEHARWLDGLSRRADNKFWVVFINDVPVGAAYLQNIDMKKETTEWGFYIGEDVYRGKGLGKQILFNFLEKVFDEMHFEILLTKVLSDNAVAIQLYRKFYFGEKGTFFSKDKREVMLFEFSSGDWARTKEKLKVMSEERVDKSVKQ